MKLLVCSDSHGRLSRFAEILSAHAETSDFLLFLGDGVRDLLRMREIYPSLRTVWVKGNNDIGAWDTKTEEIFPLLGKRLLLLHGHNHGAKQTNTGLISAGLAADTDAVLFGHTHKGCALTIPSAELPKGRERPLHLWNPGAVADGCFALLESDRNGNLLFLPTRLA